MTPIGLLGSAVGTVASIEAGMPPVPEYIALTLFQGLILYIGFQCLRGAVRIGRILKQPNLLEELQRGRDPLKGMQWSILSPFSI